MQLSDHSLRQIDEEAIRTLPEESVRKLAMKLLADLKEARERLHQDSQNSSRPPGSDAPWDKGAVAVEDDEGRLLEDDREGCGEMEQEEAVTETAQADRGDSSISGAPRKPGKQPGAQGHGREQPLSIHSCEHHRPRQCACCGCCFEDESSSLAYTAFYTLDIEWGDLDSPGIRVVNSKHIYYETTCCCGHQTREAPCQQAQDPLLADIELSQWRLVGPGLAALIVCLAFRMRLSRPRIQEFLDDWLGIRLSVGTIHQAIEESGRCAMPLEEPLVAHVRASGLLHVDESTWSEGKLLLWLWVFSTSTVVVYWIAWRTAELIDNVLGEHYAGWLMSDGYPVYRHYLNRLRCWAHLVRKARGLKESLDLKAQSFGRKTLDLLNTLMAAVYAAREGPPTALSQLYQDLLANYRLECERMKEAAHAKARALAVEMLNDWEAIFRVLDHPHLPLTNNEAERALRHWVILRRMCYGTRTEQGSRVFAILASVIETCRKRNSSPWRYLETVIANRRAGLPVPLLPIAVGGE